jgi:hypothetical protein
LVLGKVGVGSSHVALLEFSICRERNVGGVGESRDVNFQKDPIQQNICHSWKFPSIVAELLIVVLLITTVNIITDYYDNDGKML